jgi:hypothetical protein
MEINYWELIKMIGEALDLFKLGPDYTLDELKLKFRDLVLIYHPSKTGDPNMFEYIKKCYAKLSENLKNRTKESKESNFNIDNFNQKFVKHKIPNVYDNGGYDKWIENTASQVEGNGAIVHNKDPEPLFTNISGLGGSVFYELGVGEIENFSGSSGSDLQFMDYKLAHTTSALVDKRHVNEPSYKTLEEITALRGQLSYDISPSQLKADIENKRQMEEYENQRIATLKKEDMKIEKRYNKMISSNRA